MGRSIIIIDDEQDIARVFQYRLEAKGYQVSVNHNPVEAIDALSKGDYDLILMDYMMPSYKGTEMCEILRKDEKYKNTPIFLMTAYTEKPEEFFKEQGASKVFYKPVDFDDLLSSIEQSIPG